MFNRGDRDSFDTRYGISVYWIDKLLVSAASERLTHAIGAHLLHRVIESGTIGAQNINSENILSMDEIDNPQS